MAYLTYQELLDDAQKYKNELAREVDFLKRNWQTAENNNNAASKAAVTPQILVKTEQSKIWFLVAAILIFYIMKGKK